MEEFITLDFDEILETKTVKEQVQEDQEELETVDVPSEDGIDGEEDVQEIEVNQVKEIYKVISSVLPIDENEEPTTEWLEEQVNDAPRKLLEVAITSMPQDAQVVLGYIANKPDFTMQDLVEYTKQFVPNQVDVETMEGAKQYLKSNPAFAKMYDADELDEELDRLEDNDKLLTKAKKLKEAEDSIKIAEATKLAQQTKEQQEANLAKQKQLAKELNVQVDSLGWKEDTKRSVFENLKSERVQFVNNKLKENPKAIVQMAHIYSFFDEKTGFDKLFEVLEGKSKSKKAEETKDKLQQSKLSGLVRTVTQPTKIKTNDWVPEI